MSTPTTNKGRGLLQINAAATRKPTKQAPRQPAPRLRLIIRRLPPGLTENEFWNILSTEWQVGKGKVDWAAFKAGKISKDLAKPSKPARAYLKVKDPAHLEPLSQHVRAITFQDAKNSLRDPCLVGPPSLEFAPYSKIPGGRARHDGRQGTIDQDPEFIDFLQSLTEPIVKPSANGESVEAKSDKAVTTPLVQYIKEKKANKAKEKEAAAVAKASKKATDVKEAKETKEKSSAPSKSEQRSTVVKKTANTDAEKARVAKATQDAMTAINRSVAAMKGKPVTEKSDAIVPAPQTTPSPQATPKRERRGDASAAARIIGRDLGLTPKEGRTPRSQRHVSTPAVAQTPVVTAATKTNAATSTPSTTTPKSTPAPAPAAATPAAPSPKAPQNSSQSSAPAQAPTGPRNLRNATPQQPKQQQQQQRSNQTTNTPKSAGGKPPPQPSAGAKSAFLKHANPSQGVTEDLLRTTFSTYGTITRCEIDKKKGLGYVDFTDTDSLRKAMAASPVKIGNGSVVVLENRTPYRKISSQTPSRPGTASPALSAASSPKPTNAIMASITEQVTPSSSASPQKATAANANAPSKSSTATSTLDANNSKKSAPADTSPATTTAPSAPATIEPPQSAGPTAGPATATATDPSANPASSSIAIAATGAGENSTSSPSASTPASRGSSQNSRRGGHHRGNRGNRGRGGQHRGGGGGNNNNNNRGAKTTAANTKQDNNTAPTTGPAKQGGGGGGGGEAAKSVSIPPATNNSSTAT